jgi:hypothetical protein
MTKIKYFFHKNSLLIFSILFLVLFSGAMKLFAADPPPPVGGYSPGDTLDPGCLPTDPNCIVDLGTAFTIDANDNMFAGTNAGSSLTTGLQNFFTGVNSGRFNTT